MFWNHVRTAAALAGAVLLVELDGLPEVVDSQAVRVRAEEVCMDIRALDFMSSGCFKHFASNPPQALASTPAFALLIFTLSMLQHTLDKRKDRRKKAAKARAGAELRARVAQWIGVGGDRAALDER